MLLLVQLPGLREPARPAQVICWETPSRETTIRSYFALAAMGIAAGALLPVQPASAFLANQQQVVQAATAAAPIIEVKRAPSKGRPPGWNHGRKVGWHGHGRPPGQI